MLTFQSNITSASDIMSIKSGIIVVHDAYSFPIDNVALASFCGNDIFVSLKNHAVDDKNLFTLTIKCQNDNSAKYYFDNILEYFCLDGIYFIPSNDEYKPKYDLSTITINRDGLLVIDHQTAISSSNIGLIMYKDNNVLRIFLRQHVKISNSKPDITYYDLKFNSKNQRQDFHDRLITTIFHGKRIDYVS